MAEKLNEYLNGEGLQYLFNNAGVLFRAKDSHIQTPGVPKNIDFENGDTFVDTYKVNVIGTFMVTKVLLF